jgi:lipopolysaccharide export system protein LptA
MRRILVVLMMTAAPLLFADTFTYAGDSATTVLAEGSQHALLTGHAQVKTKDLRITADSIELFGKDFIYAQCKGNVRVVDTRRGLDLTSQELFYDRDRKIARIKGNAVMSDLKNEMVVKGGFIEDRDTEQITIVQIGVRIFKKDIVCRSEFAKYWREKKMLELSGMPWVSKASDIYQAARITVNLDTEDITLEGDVQGTIQTPDKGKSKDAGGGGTAAGGTAGDAGGSAAPPGGPSPASTMTPPPGTSPAATPGAAPAPPPTGSQDAPPPAMKKEPPDGQ